MTPQYLHELATFAVDTRSEDIPPGVQCRARDMIADSIGCMLAGSQAPEVQRLAESTFDRSRIEEAAPPGLAMRLPVEQAAFLGGIAGTWHDLDEGNLHTRTHAAIQIVPVLIAQAQRAVLNGQDFIDAFVIAYEVVSRLWRAATIRFAVHPHGTTGAVAGAVALARLRGVGVDEMVAIINIAMALGTVSSRHTLNDGATVRNVYTGNGARTAFEAMALFDAGFRGETDAPTSVLGSIYGDAFDASQAAQELGSTWWIATCYFKRFASARYLHGPLDLLETINADAQPDQPAPLLAESIERIDVETYFMAATMAQQSVNSAFGMRFSLPQAMATRIVRGPMSLTDDSSAAFGDPQVRDLAQRIFVHEDTDATALYPAQQPSRLRLRYRDGRQLEVAAPRIVGEGDCPLPTGALRAKFMELGSAAMTGPLAEQTWKTLTTLESVDNVARLCDAWIAAAPVTT